MENIQIYNALTDIELEELLNNLIESNWIVKKMINDRNKDELPFKDARDTINKWWSASRPDLLKKLGIYENGNFKGVYHLY